MNTTTKALLRPGDRLPNGALVLHATEHHGEGVVLAYTGGAQPFVTWRYRAGAPESTGSGHYTSDLADAVADYAARGGNTVERNVGDGGWAGHEGPVVIREVCTYCLEGGPHSSTCSRCAACCSIHG